MRYQISRLHTGLVRFHQKMDTRIFKFLGAALELMEDNFQARGLTTLEGLELCSTNRMVYPFQIGPCETQVRSMHLTNSFMYRKETITAAYEGAGWTFPTENYCFTPPLRVHHQGFEIIRAQFLLLLFYLRFWNLPWSLIGYLLWMLWLMNGTL